MTVFGASSLSQCGGRREKKMGRCRGRTCSYTDIITPVIRQHRGRVTPRVHGRAEKHCFQLSSLITGVRVGLASGDGGTARWIWARAWPSRRCERQQGLSRWTEARRPALLSKCQTAPSCHCVIQCCPTCPPPSFLVHQCPLQCLSPCFPLNPPRVSSACVIVLSAQKWKSLRGPWCLFKHQLDCPSISNMNNYSLFFVPTPISDSHHSPTYLLACHCTPTLPPPPPSPAVLV